MSRNHIFLLIFMLLPAAAAASGILTPFVSLKLPGEWEERPAYVRELPGDGDMHAFYETTSGSLLHVARYPGKLELDEAEQSSLLTVMSKDETFWGEPPHPRFARFLANEIFMPTQDYHHQNTPYIALAIETGKQYPTLEMWNMTGVTGDAQVFYTSQLTPRIATARVGEVLHMGEVYVPLQMTRAERSKFGKAEAILLEVQTAEPVREIAVRKLEMPASLTGQRLRYCMVMHAANGLDEDEAPVRIVLATPLGSGLDCDGVLTALNEQ